MTVRSRGRRAIFAVGACALALILLEGAASLTLFVREARLSFWPTIEDRLHTQYDPQLGWISLRDRRMEDVYGPGLHVTTNSRGFRGAREYAQQVPPGRLRAICLGDSFTLGHGVGDDDAWPASLERACPSVEAPNMGQSGYGIDQDYLWYLRDGITLDHDLLIFAFIGSDFDRVRVSRMVLYPKPVLRRVDGELVARNVPVPRLPYLAPLLTQNLRMLDGLRSVELARLVLRRDAPRADPWAMGEGEAAELAFEIFARLDAITRSRGARLLLVHLPHLDHDDPERLAPLPGLAREALERSATRGIPVLDLADAFASLGPVERQRLFLQESRLRGAGMHYSPAGNAFVARAIAGGLIERGLLDPENCAPVELVPGPESR